MGKNDKSSGTKSRLLGEPFGTASNRLRKAIMFSLAQRCGLGTCHRCGKPIEDAKALSIDHTVEWESADDPVAAFFDVGRVAFSHLSCNSRAAKRVKVYATRTERDAARRKRWYAKNGEAFNARRRERRAHGSLAQ